jgi:hypothetical protein
VLNLVRDEPPTESFAETRGMQHLRSRGIRVWRQIPVQVGGKEYRIDYGISLGPIRHPKTFRPDLVLLCDVDSREFHADRFQEDNDRGATEW